MKRARAWALALAVATFLAPSGAVAAPSTLVDFVNAEVSKEDLKVRVRGTLREPVVAVDAKPTMPPYFHRSELDEILTKYATYLTGRVHVLVRGRALPGKVVAARIIDKLEGPVHHVVDLEKVHTEVELVYGLGSTEPLTVSFDILSGLEASPGVPWSVIYSLDVRGGPRSEHAELAQNATFSFDVVEGAPRLPQGTERLDATPGRRTRARGSSSAIGLGIFVGIIGIGYSVLRRRKRL